MVWFVEIYRVIGSGCGFICKGWSVVHSFGTCGEMSWKNIMKVSLNGDENNHVAVCVKVDKS